MSVSVFPPSVDFQMSIASMNTASGLPGSTARPMSYHICGVSSPHGPAVVVPSTKLSVMWLATWLHVVPPLAVRHRPRKQPRLVVSPRIWRAPHAGCGSIDCTSAYITFGLLGEIAISIRPSLFALAAHFVVMSPIGGLHATPVAVPIGHPLASVAQLETAGHPLGGI